MVTYKKRTNIILAAVIIVAVSLVSLCVTPDCRPEHCIEDKCIDERAFSKLPNFPCDFSDSVNKDTPENFYKQPQFYPNFEGQGLHYYITPPSDYMGAFGYGAYPSLKTIKIKEGEEAAETVFFYTSWYIVNYQGMELYVINDSLKDYVTIDPKVILLEPTFPFFEYNWTQKIKISVKNLPKGKHMIGVDLKAPPIEYGERWSEEYKGRYSDAGMFGIDKPFYELDVTVS